MILRVLVVDKKQRVGQTALPRLVGRFFAPVDCIHLLPGILRRVRASSKPTSDRTVHLHLSLGPLPGMYLERAGVVQPGPHITYYSPRASPRKPFVRVARMSSTASTRVTRYSSESFRVRFCRIVNQTNLSYPQGPRTSSKLFNDVTRSGKWPRPPPFASP